MVYPTAIEDLIPHRDRMKLIEVILDITDDGAVTSAVVSERWPLLRNNGVDPIVIIEIVAQTAAVHVSWKRGACTSEGGGGLLVGIKKADFYTDSIPLHTVLTTTVRSLYSAENYTVLEGAVQEGANPVGRVEIQVIRFESGEDNPIRSEE
jgi:predicted hotdog family 3-hydroxylacyl-ACP dehydratase